MKWMVHETSLDAVQKRTIDEIIENQDENHWIKGFAGSGKTIVLTHVLERLATSKRPVKVCFATFTHALKDMVESGLSETARKRIDVSTFNGLSKLRSKYDIVVADEMQDIPSRLLPVLAKKSDVLIVAADLDQSIYRSACKVEELTSAIRPNTEHQLLEIHRINENVFKVATSVYTDAKVVRNTQIRQDSSKTRILKAGSRREEFVTVYEEAERLSSLGNPSAILLPSKDLIDKFISAVASEKIYSGAPPSVKDGEKPEFGEQADPFRDVNAYLKKNKSPLQVFGGGSGSLYDSDKRKMIYLMTYHSAKGLDFPNVFLPHLTDDVSLEPMKGSKDDQERRIFFVAATRAKGGLYLSYHDEPHRFLEEIPTYLLEEFKKKKRTY